MELTHTFTVPVGVEETWLHFQDIASLAACFPGATVTDSDGDTFAGSCKVKLGPIALVYAGSGTFTERDDAAHRYVVDAKGKDKRGNGTAGAVVTLSMTEAGDSTVVTVLTDLAITGKPAQFGRGVMQDVSDKLLGQFVNCLEQRLGSPEVDQDAEPASAPLVEEVAQRPSRDPAEEGAKRSLVEEVAQRPSRDPVEEVAQRPSRDQPHVDDALDLGSAVLPVLVKSYGKQIAVAVVGVLGLMLVIRRLRRLSAG